MIDDELYQQANDELASERRDLRVWAKACSLAPEDHDEARFLYTNLRVEALLVERRAGLQADRGALAAADGGTAAPGGASGEAQPDPEADGVPIADPVPAGRDRGGDERASAPAYEDDDISALFAAPEGGVGERFGFGGAGGQDGATPTDIGDEPGAPAPDGPRHDAEASPDSPSSRRDGDIDDLDDFDADLEGFGELDSPGRESARPPAAAAFSTAPDLDPVRADRDRLTATGAARAATTAGADARAGVEEEIDHVLLQELERQARDLPPARERGVDTAPTNVPLFEERARPDPASEEASTGAFEIDVGGRHDYAVYHRSGSRDQAVRQGGSIGALLLTLPWLLYRGLFGTALAYVLFVAAAIAGLTITALAWLDAGAAASMPTRVAAVTFASLLLLGTLLAPWWQANRWRREKLERRGFELVARVRAPNRKAAFEAFGLASRERVRHAAH